MRLTADIDRHYADNWYRLLVYICLYYKQID